jgi:hypothetical protein
VDVRGRSAWIQPAAGDGTDTRVGTPPLTFTLARDPGPIPGSLDRNILQLLAAADQTRDRGDHLEALAAYQQIRAQNPKLTALNLSIADVFRRQAAIEIDPAVRRALLERAIEAYTLALNDETTGKRAAGTAVHLAEVWRCRDSHADARARPGPMARAHVTLFGLAVAGAAAMGWYARESPAPGPIVLVAPMACPRQTSRLRAQRRHWH